MAKLGFADQTTEWQQLVTTVEVNQTELAFLESPRSLLAAVLDRAKEASLRQSAFKAQFHQATRDLEKALSEGGDLATRLRNGIRTQYGLRGEKLTEFGLQPRRKSQKTKTEPAPAVPATTKP